MSTQTVPVQRARRQAAWKPNARLAPKPRPVSVWCKGAVQGLNLPQPAWERTDWVSNRYLRDDEALRMQARIQQKYIRCETCGRRLRPRYVPNHGSFWEFGSWIVPRHKAKP